MLKRKLFSMLCAGVMLVSAAAPSAFAEGTEDTKINLNDKTQSGSQGWNNQNNSENAFDDDVDTYFDGLKNGWCSIDLGKAYDITKISFYPRDGRLSNKSADEYVGRMVGGVFKGSVNGEEWTDIYTIEESMLTIGEDGTKIRWYDIELTGTYRYIKYENNVNAANIAEIAVYGTESAVPAITVGTKENCTVTYPDELIAGGSAEVKMTANEGYEFGKLNVNGVSVAPNVSDDRKTATYTIEALTGSVTVDAWADPAGRLMMNEMTAEEFKKIAPGITVYSNLPAEYSDGITSADNNAGYDKYPGFTVCDAGEGNKYNITKVIMYAYSKYAGRSCIKIYGSDTLCADMFRNDAGADTKDKRLVALKHGNNNLFGTGNWSGNATSDGTDSVRGEYTVDANPGYRYIIIASNNTHALSLSELKLYGEIVPTGEQTHDSGYFGFTANEEQFKSFNKIAIQTDNNEWRAADWTCPTSFTGEASVKYAIRITDVPEGTVITNIKLYTDNSETGTTAID